MLAIDTETTGLDLNHGCQAFLVVMANESGSFYWRGSVNRKTRKVTFSKNQLEEIEKYIEEEIENAYSGANPNEDSCLIFHNAKFDLAALRSIGIEPKEHWWDAIYDTSFQSHLVNSAEPHDLTYLARRYLKLDITPLEEAIDSCTKEARALSKSLRDPFAIASEEFVELLPSLKGKSHKCDMWLPGEIAKEFGYDSSHSWHTVLEEYAEADAVVTLELFKKFSSLIYSQGLENVHHSRRKLIRVIYEMELNGTTFNLDRLENLHKTLTSKVHETENKCLSIAKKSGSVLTKLPKSGTTKEMRKMLFEDWKVPVLARSEKTNEPSLDKHVVEALLLSLKDEKHLEFFKNLSLNRKSNTGLSYLQSYKKFGLKTKDKKTYKLHCSLNAIGQVTLRWSSSNPNEQNISKQKMGVEGSEWSIRYCFGPPPGYEWWSLDYANIELRIPGYHAKEQLMIDLFEKPNDPPYYGSQHMLVASLLWPIEFQQCLKNNEEFNKKYKATLYQWTKNGNFAVTYGALEEYGTADAAYHQKGAHTRVKQMFSNIEKFNQECINSANENGYVTTLYDYDVGGQYPIQTPRIYRGKARPTVPLNYVVQSTAMWCMGKAMIRVSDYLRTLPGNCHIAMQIHDELVICMPKTKRPGANLPKVRKIRQLMEQSGEDINIPLLVEYSYHPDNWGEEYVLAN